ncbi:SDR family oxidoreductase [Streptomyces abikoensis]|uniref:SDR family oxidoreductase n=1 Tax=Streptomyces abikoensis TaxID=97398 RepID=UPI0036834DF6
MRGAGRHARAGRRVRTPVAHRLPAVGPGPRPHVRAVPGDLDQPRLGLSPETYDTPARTVEIVCHDGARVNHPEVSR